MKSKEIELDLLRLEECNDCILTVISLSYQVKETTYCCSLCMNIFRRVTCEYLHNK